MLLTAPLSPTTARSPLPWPSSPWGSEEGLLLRSVVVFQLKKHCATRLRVQPLGVDWGPKGNGSHEGPLWLAPRFRLSVPRRSPGLPVRCFP